MLSMLSLKSEIDTGLVNFEKFVQFWLLQNTQSSKCNIIDLESKRQLII